MHNADNKPNRDAEKALRSILKKQNADGGLLVTIKRNESGMALIADYDSMGHTAALLAHLAETMHSQLDPQQETMYEIARLALTQKDTRTSRYEN